MDTRATYLFETPRFAESNILSDGRCVFPPSTDRSPPRMNGVAECSGVRLRPFRLTPATPAPRSARVSSQSYVTVVCGFPL